MLAAIRGKLLGLGLDADTMARSLALGMTLGVLPIYIPILPTLYTPALAKAAGLSAAAAFIGMNLATILFVPAMVMYIRAGDLLSGSEPLAVDGLLASMRADVVGALSEFGIKLAAAFLAWLVTAPLVAIGFYSAFHPVCAAVVGESDSAAAKRKVSLASGSCSSRAPRHATCSHRASPRPRRQSSARLLAASCPPPPSRVRLLAATSLVAATGSWVQPLHRSHIAARPHPLLAHGYDPHHAVRADGGPRARRPPRDRVVRYLKLCD